MCSAGPGGAVREVWPSGSPRPAPAVQGRRCRLAGRAWRRFPCSRGLVHGLLVAALGCGGQPFPGSSGSLDELGRGIVEAFRADDRDALEAFRLTESEHNTVVWPELPASRGEFPFPPDLAWRNLQLRNRRAIPRAHAVLRQAEPIKFDSVACLGETQAFETFVVHTDCHTRFRTRGRLYGLQLFKDVLERNGGFKVFRYYDEDPEPVTEASRPNTGEPASEGEA